MRYLSGVPYAACMYWQYGGLMLTPDRWGMLNLSDVTWAADNGCYTAGERFDPLRWLGFLKRWQEYSRTCLFAVAPDVPFNMAATLERSLPYLPEIRALNYPAALAIQNGVEHLCLDWNTFDAVFIAGTKAFKTSWVAFRVIQEAKAHGKHVHIARRNSLRALQEAFDMGADTVDGTHLKYAPDRDWPGVQRWFRRLHDCHEVGLWEPVPRIVLDTERQVVG